jgi:CelD/BcsL family acetyltransferase involved in cellulose biosynthesis
MASWLRTISPVYFKTYHHSLLQQNLTLENTSLVRNLQQRAGRDWVRAYVLFAGDRPVAYALGYLAGRRFTYELPGYDPDLAAHSPGLILVLRLIEDLITRGEADVLDFGSGDNEYKQLFATRSYLEVSALLVRDGRMARGLAAVYGGLAAVSRLGAEVLARHGVKRRVLGWLRRRSPAGAPEGLPGAVRDEPLERGR